MTTCEYRCSQLAMGDSFDRGLIHTTEPIATSGIDRSILTA
jgi:hypothetical protein